MTEAEGFETGFERGPGFLLTQYLRTLRSILWQPSSYFRAMPVSGGLAGPLAFALVTHWIGAAIGHLWTLLLSGAMGDYTRTFYQVITDLADVNQPGSGDVILRAQDRISHWVWGTGSVILDPFLTLASVLFTSFLVWIAARLLVSSERFGQGDVRYESAARIVCFGMSPAILASLPVFGGFLAGTLTLIVTVIGAREVYRIGYGRALVVALFPKLLFLGIMVLGFLFFMISLLKLVATAI